MTDHDHDLHHNGCTVFDHDPHACPDHGPLDVDDNGDEVCRVCDCGDGCDPLPLRLCLCGAEDYADHDGLRACVWCGGRCDEGHPTRLYDPGCHKPGCWENA